MWKLFRIFFKVGSFTLGGGLAMLPILQRELVDRHKLLSEEDFLDMTALSQTLPGLIAVNFAIFVGNKINGWKGALAAGLGAVVPSFSIILLIAVFFRQFKDNEVVVSVFRGIRPAVVALLLIPVFTMARSAGINWKNFWLPVLVAVVISFIGVSPVYVMLAALAGALLYHFAKKCKQ